MLNCRDKTYGGGVQLEARYVERVQLEERDGGDVLPVQHICQSRTPDPVHFVSHGVFYQEPHKHRQEFPHHSRSARQPNKENLLIHN